MFAKDFHLLNEIYNNKVYSEMNVGPKGDNEDVTPTPNNIVKMRVPERTCMKGEGEEHCAAAAKGCKCGGCPECKENQKPSEDCEGFDATTYDSNSKMSRQLLYRIHKLSAMLHDLLNNKDNVEAWVLSKITNAHDQLQSAFGYEDYENALNAQGFSEVEENNEEALINAINLGGDNVIATLRKALKRESREVLEKVLLETIVLLENKK